MKKKLFKDKEEALKEVMNSNEGWNDSTFCPLIKRNCVHKGCSCWVDAFVLINDTEFVVHYGFCNCYMLHGDRRIGY